MFIFMLFNVDCVVRKIFHFTLYNVFECVVVFCKHNKFVRAILRNTGAGTRALACKRSVLFCRLPNHIVYSSYLHSALISNNPYPSHHMYLYIIFKDISLIRHIYNIVTMTKLILNRLMKLGKFFFHIFQLYEAFMIY